MFNMENHMKIKITNKTEWVISNVLSIFVFFCSS